MTKNKSLILALLLSVASSTIAFAQQAAPAAGAPAAAAEWKFKVKKLDRADYDALLAKPDQVLVIDVRRPDEQTNIGSFPVYLSIQAKDLEKYIAFIPRDRALITVSNHAGRAGAAGDLLASKGFKIGGAIGVQDYEAQGGTLSKIPVPPPRVASAASATTTH